MYPRVQPTNRNCEVEVPKSQGKEGVINILISLSSFSLISYQLSFGQTPPETISQGGLGETVSRSQPQDKEQGREAWRMEVRLRVASPELLFSSWTPLCGQAERPWLWLCLSLKADCACHRAPILIFPGPGYFVHEAVPSPGVSPIPGFSGSHITQLSDLTLYSAWFISPGNSSSILYPVSSLQPGV